MISLFPFSFFYSASYTESLFLLLAAASFYWAEEDRWGLAALAGLFCTAGKAVALFLLPALLLRYLEKKSFIFKKIRKDICCLFAIPFGAIAYFCFLHVSFGGNPLVLIHAAEKYWERDLFNFTRMQYAFTHFLADGKACLYLFYVFLIIIFLWLAIKAWRSLSASYALFSLCLISLPLLTSLQCTGRYLSVIFPCFIALACAVTSLPLRYALYVISSGMLAALSVYFILGGRLY